MTTAFGKSVREHVVGTLKSATWSRGHMRTIDAAEQMLAYSDTLATLRKHKATASRPSMRLEAHIVDRARAARDAGRGMLADTLTNLQVLRETDWPKALFASMAAVGNVDLAAELRDVLGDAKLQPALHACGVSPGLLAAVQKVVAKSGIEVAASGTGLAAMVPDHPKIHLRLTDETLLRTGTKSPAGAGSLLRQPMFDMLVESFSKGSLPSSLPLRGRAKQREDIQLDLFDAAGLGALITLTELEAHLRRLECGGLSTHVGSEGAVEALLAVLIVGVILVAIGGIITGIGEIAGDDGVVAAGMVVMGIGMILIGVGGGVLVGMFDPFAGVAVLVAGVAFGGAFIAAPFI